MKGEEGEACGRNSSVCVSEKLHIMLQYYARLQYYSKGDRLCDTLQECVFLYSHQEVNSPLLRVCVCFGS